MKVRLVAAGASIAVATLFAQSAAAAGMDLPKTMAWGAYGVGSGGYNQAVAIGSALKQKYGVNLRIIPGKNDISRMLPLKTGKLDFVANGVGTYMAQEGLYEFGAHEWGPQPVRMLMASNSDQALTVIVAKDTGVKTVSDLKGKRVSWVIGAPALNQNVTAILAFAGLTWKDVKKVEFGGYGASLDAIVNNQSDAAFSTSVSGKAFALAKSPRGIVYPVMPKSDKEGWKRVQAIAPFMVPALGTAGAEISKENPVESSGYPYPILMTMADRKTAEVQSMTEAMLDTFDVYKDSAPGNNGWALDRQNFEWVVPYHEGAIKVFKAKGVWSAAAQKHNDMLIKRQKVLAAAWAKVTAAKLDPQAHMVAWQRARASALKDAGMPVVLESW